MCIFNHLIGDAKFRLQGKPVQHNKGRTKKKELLSEHAGMLWGRLRSTWNWIWQGMSKTTRRTSSGTSAANRTLLLHSLVLRLPSGIPGPGGKRGSLQKRWPLLDRGGLCERSLKQPGCPLIHGPQWNAPMSAEGPGDVTAEPLSIVFERSWRRKANVTPILKKGKKEDPGNYRPVRLSSIPGKVMEQLILEVIIRQVEEK